MSSMHSVALKAQTEGSVAYITLRCMRHPDGGTMENSDRELINLGKKMIAELKELAVVVSSIESQSSSIAERAKSNYESRKAPPVLKSELQIPQSIVQDWARENRKSKPLDKWSLFVNVGTLVAVAIYATINLFMLCAMRKADKTTADQLMAFKKVEGASIGAAMPVGDINVGEVRLAIVNYSRIPSPRVWIYPHVYRSVQGQQRPNYFKDYEFGGDDTQIPPTSSGIGYGFTLPLEFKAGELDKLREGTETLWVAVSLKYDDGFGNVSPMIGACYAWNRLHPVVWDACPTFSFAHLPK